MPICTFSTCESLPSFWWRLLKSMTWYCFHLNSFSVFSGVFEKKKKNTKSFPRACSSFMAHSRLDDAGILLQKHWILDYFFHTCFAWKICFFHPAFFHVLQLSSVLCVREFFVIFQFSKIDIIYWQGFACWKPVLWRCAQDTLVLAISLLVESRVAPFSETCY